MPGARSPGSITSRGRCDRQPNRTGRGHAAARVASAHLFSRRARVAGIQAEQRSDLRLLVAPVAAWRADAANPARRGPPGDCLRVYAEKGSDLSGREQAITVAIHSTLLQLALPPRT